MTVTAGLTLVCGEENPNTVEHVDINAAASAKDIDLILSPFFSTQTALTNK